MTDEITLSTRAQRAESVFKEDRWLSFATEFVSKYSRVKSC